MKVPITMRSTRTPEARAALRSEPIARTSRPSQVKAKTAARTRKMPTAIRLRWVNTVRTGSFSLIVSLMSL